MKAVIGCDIGTSGTKAIVVSETRKAISSFFSSDNDFRFYSKRLPISLHQE